MKDNCFCGSNKPYSECCEKIHEAPQAAKTAEELMRARYSAFVLGKIDFLYNSFHPQTRRHQKKSEIQQWSEKCLWQELQILEVRPEIVVFKAYYLDSDMNLQLHHEKSRFKKLNEIWYYVDGTLLN